MITNTISLREKIPGVSTDAVVQAVISRYPRHLEHTLTTVLRRLGRCSTLITPGGHCIQSFEAPITMDKGLVTLGTVEGTADYLGLPAAKLRAAVAGKPYGGSFYMAKDRVGFTLPSEATHLPLIVTGSMLKLSAAINEFHAWITDCATTWLEACLNPPCGMFPGLTPAQRFHQLTQQSHATTATSPRGQSKRQETRRTEEAGHARRKHDSRGEDALPLRRPSSRPSKNLPLGSRNPASTRTAAATPAKTGPLAKAVPVRAHIRGTGTRRPSHKPQAIRTKADQLDSLMNWLEQPIA